MMNTLTPDETAEILKALHQWLTSQGIERRHWGLLLAKAAGHEVYHYGRDKEDGLAVLNIAMRLHAARDMIYDKS
jgi:hypothetical protein